MFSNHVVWGLRLWQMSEKSWGSSFYPLAERCNTAAESLRDFQFTLGKAPFKHDEKLKKLNNQWLKRRWRETTKLRLRSTKYIPHDRKQYRCPDKPRYNAKRRKAFNLAAHDIPASTTETNSLICEVFEFVPSIFVIPHIGWWFSASSQIGRASCRERV